LEGVAIKEILKKSYQKVARVVTFSEIERRATNKGCRSYREFGAAETYLSNILQAGEQTNKTIENYNFGVKIQQIIQHKAVYCPLLFSTN
jgi:hypothetical protein